MSTTLYPAPRLVINGKRFVRVSDGKSRPISELKYHSLPYGRVPVFVDGKFGWLMHDDASDAGYRLIVGGAPAPRLSIYVENGLSRLNVFDEHGRIVAIATCDLTTGARHACVYTGFAVAHQKAGGRAGCDGFAAELALKQFLAPLDFARRAPALERAA